jgi:hypothetical protein
MKKCIDCDIEFSKKMSSKGTINQCDDCSESLEDERYLGFNDGSLNKSTSIGIYRGTDKTVRKKISNQKARTGI